MLDLAGHLGGHLGLLGVDAVRVGNLVSLLAVNLGHLEVNLSGHQFALSPSDGFASLISGPNLNKIIIIYYQENIQFRLNSVCR